MVIKIKLIELIKYWCLWREEHCRTWRKPSEKVPHKLNSTHKTDSQASNSYMNRWMVHSSTLHQPPLQSTTATLSTFSYLLWGNMAKQRHFILDRSCNRMLASTHNLQLKLNSDQIRHTDNLFWRPLTQVIMTIQWIEVESCVKSFIWITVFCQLNLRAGAFVSKLWTGLYYLTSW